MCVFFFKQKTAYEMRISDWSSDVCSSDLETAGIFADVQMAIRQLIPPEEIATLVDNVGMPVSGINMTYNNTGTIGPQDGDIQIKLREGHRPTAEYVRMLREELPSRFPGETFS